MDDLFIIYRTHMKINLKISYGNIENDKAVVDRLVSENLSGKLDAYLQKFEGDDVEALVSFGVEKNKQDHFNGTLHANIDGKSFHYAREDYKKLDDLINHLFDHLKESIADQK